MQQTCPLTRTPAMQWETLPWQPASWESFASTFEQAASGETTTEGKAMARRNRSGHLRTCQRTCLLHVLLNCIDLCCMVGVPFQISPYYYSTWCCFVPPLVMSKYVKPPTWKKAVPLQVEDCSIIPSYLPLICCKFSGWLCKRLQWASPAVQWGEVLPKK